MNSEIRIIRRYARLSLRWEIGLGKPTRNLKYKMHERINKKMEERKANAYIRTIARTHLRRSTFEPVTNIRTWDGMKSQIELILMQIFIFRNVRLRNEKMQNENRVDDRYQLSPLTPRANLPSHTFPPMRVGPILRQIIIHYLTIHLRLDNNNSSRYTCSFDILHRFTLYAPS